MKTRLITAAVGVPLAAVIIFIVPVWATGIVIGLLSMAGSYELLHCAYPKVHLRILIMNAVFSFGLPLAFALGFKIRWSIWAILLIFFIYSLDMILTHGTKKAVRFDQLSALMLSSVIFPLMFGSLGRLLTEMDTVGRVSVAWPFVIAFTADGGAYFAGRFFGKHKMAPVLSPKKTWEGAVGGVLSGVVFSLIYALILHFCKYGVNFASVALMGLVGSFVSQIGDLAFSAIKRQYGIKDYGYILPGHGGILDRFDSMYYLAPLTEFWMLVYPAIWMR